MIGGEGALAAFAGGGSLLFGDLIATLAVCLEAEVADLDLVLDLVLLGVVKTLDGPGSGSV